jgi:hypothetical protein
MDKVFFETDKSKKEGATFANSEALAKHVRYKFNVTTSLIRTVPFMFTNKVAANNLLLHSRLT